ncbi:DUF6086 family protein [Streptomyces rishiriensis]|uniref:DUF6086 family protein n=1 Tax=Streptomyces rishiriensis TaxID=68264 RepID=UPI00131F0A14|nr:DUF6086 family protein [Streptomyces rishiriensis]
MSYIFTVSETDEDVWEPALAIGQLFMGGVNALSSLIMEMPSGLHDVSGDWVKIDADLYGAFVNAVLKERGVVTHPELVMLMDGLLPLMVMLADKVGVEITAATLPERVCLEWARDKDRVLQGHAWDNLDGTVTVWKSGVVR